MTRRLALVRHSTPVIDQTVPAREWRLSDEGRSRCQAAADALAAVSASRIYSSEEPKAVGTAQEIGRRLGLPVTIASDLHEHERPRLPFFEASEWHTLIAELFARPDSVVLGHETGNQASQRFARAIERLVRSTDDEDLIVVTHGTVMSLYLSVLLSIGAFQIWENLKMPDVWIVDLSEPA